MNEYILKEENDPFDSNVKIYRMTDHANGHTVFIKVDNLFKDIVLEEYGIIFTLFVYCHMREYLKTMIEIEQQSLFNESEMIVVFTKEPVPDHNNPTHFERSIKVSFEKR